METHYRTRSSVRPKTKRNNRLPHSVSSNVSYEQEGNLSSEDDKSPVSKKCIKLCPKREPSSAQIKVDNFVTKPPPVTPLRRSARNIVPKLDAKPVATPDPAPNPQASNTPQPNNITKDSPNKDSVSTKGDFKTQRFSLKRSKKPRKFGCKMCDKVCESIHELSVHHQQMHNILYCDVCTKAFNNPASLARHKYIHQEAKFQYDDCDQSFPFESSLKSHRVSHHTLATFFCSHTNCTKKFKNKGNLTRHIKEHDSVLHECPDCDYKNADIRNLESHRIKHSKIEKYSCKLCEKCFNYNTQL